MATPQTMEEAKAELERLRLSLGAGEITLEEYAKQSGPIMRQMNVYLIRQTKPKEPDLPQDAVLRNQIRENQPKLIYGQVRREAELDALKGEDESLEDRFAKATQEVERQLYPQRFKTKEFEEPIPAQVMVSNVRDPVKGLVRDSETGELRKAGFFELLGEGMKRQVLQTPRQKRLVEEEYAQKDRQLVQRLKEEGKTRKQIESALNMERMVRESPLVGDTIIEDETRAMVVESPLEWGMRTFLNTGSAALAPLVKEAQDVVSVLTGAPVSTRKDAGYQKTERDEYGMQFITNFLLNQGVMSQQQAQLNPADENYDGLLNIATQGSTGSFILGMMGETAATPTPVGIPGEAAKAINLSKRLATKPLRASKSVKAQKVANAINNPIEGARYHGQRVEIDEALRTVDEGQTAQKLEEEIASRGGVINRSSLREKAAQRTGDISGSIAVLKSATEAPENIKAGIINYDDLDLPQSSFLKGIFDNKKTISIDEAKQKVKNFEDRISTFPKDGKEVVALRRVNQVSEDARNFILKGEKPKTDAKIINRNATKARWMNQNIWEIVGTSVPKRLRKDWTLGRELTLKSFQTPLTVDEIMDLGKSWKKLDDANVWDDIPKGFESYKNIYDSVRGSVADVMRDNFLKNIPDDFIYVSKDVAVPIKSYKSPTFKTYKTEIQKLLKFTPQVKGDEVFYLMNDDALNALRQRQKRTGMQLPKNIDESLQAKVPLTMRQMQDLTSTVSGDIALELLDGVRLKTGTLTSQMARLPEGTPRQTLIKTGSTPASFTIQRKGLANALRLIITGNPILNKFSGRLTKNLKKMSPRFFGVPKADLPPTFQRFSDEITRANNAAMDQVLDRYKRSAQAIKDPTEAFNAVLRKDLDLGVQQYKTQRLEQAVRKDLPVEDIAKYAESERLLEQNILEEKYGQTYVKDFLEEQGIKSRDDFMDNIDFIESNMSTVLDTTARLKQWKASLADFFTSAKMDQGERLSILQRYQNYVEDLVRIDNTQPFWTPNNVLPLDIGNFKKIIDEIRNKDESLKNIGLSRMKPFKEEYYTLPLLSRSFETQRVQNMERAITSMIDDTPDMFVDLNRSTKSMISLKDTEELAVSLLKQVRETSHLAVKSGFLTDESLTLILNQMKEKLFDGFAKDVWINTSRDVQKSFFQEYLTKMVRDKTAVVSDMDGFFAGLFDSGVLKSNTFDTLRIGVREIIEKVNKTLKKMKKNPKKFGILAEGDSLKEQIKIVEELEKALPSLLDSMQVDYLNNLVMKTGGVYEGLFSEQLAAINKYFTQYGVGADSLDAAMKELSPRLQYIGSKNIAVIAGIDMESQIKSLVEMSNGMTSSQLSKYFEQLAGYKQNNLITPQYIFSYLGQALTMTRRWATSNMLGGAYELALRYFGTNVFTAPFIYLTTLGDKSMKASTFAKFTGAAFTGGTLPALEKLLSKAGFTTGIKSNRYLYAPADEVIIKAQPGGAVRDYTAGELRALAEEYGIDYSRADADFYDTQFERFLIDVKLNPDGSSRYGGSWGNTKEIAGSLWKTIIRRAWDNISASRRNVFTELGRFQDAQQRRLVFIDSIQNGETIPQAAEKARRSILDYNTLSDFEKQYMLNAFYFYSFTRTMGAEVINAFYRAAISGNNIPFKVLQLQNAINRQLAQDYVDQQDTLKGRFFNIYTGTVDGIDMYAGGMMNPQVDMFDYMCRASLIVASPFVDKDPFVQEQESLIQKISTSFMIAGIEGGKTLIKGNPFVSLAYEGATVDWGKRPIPFPSELISEAEQSGRLPEIIKQYGLVKRPYKTAGRPLSSQGDYWDFPTTPDGKSKYIKYLSHRAIGLTAFNIIAYKGGWVAAQSRGQKERTRASIYARQDLTIPDPNDPTKTIVIKDFTSYAKSIGRGDLTLSPNVLYTLYRLGQTPLKSVPIETVEERILRDIKNTQEKILKGLPKE